MVYKKTAQKIKAHRKAAEKAAKPTKQKKEANVGKQIRDFKRLLQKDGLDYRMRKALNKRLELLQQKQDEHKQEELNRKLSVRYHMAKFFERQKIQRRIDKLEAKVKKSGVGLSDEESKELVQLNEDLQYVKHFPKGEKFVSLLKQAEDPKQQEALEKERTRLRNLVRQQLADEAMLADEDEGKAKGFISKVQKVKESSSVAEADNKKANDGKLKKELKLDSNVIQPSTKRKHSEVSKSYKPTLPLKIEKKTDELDIDVNEENDLENSEQQQKVESFGFDDDFFLGENAEPSDPELVKATKEQEVLPKEEKLQPSKTPVTNKFSKKDKVSKHPDRLKEKKGRMPGKAISQLPSKAPANSSKFPVIGQSTERNGFQQKTKKPETKPFQKVVKSQKQNVTEAQPQRSRAEGGRKRRKKK